MKLFEGVDATLHVQSYGTVFLIVVKGSEKGIETYLNALYNFGGTARRNFEAEYNDNHTIAWFWTYRRDMLNFFRNLFFFRNADSFSHRRNNGWVRRNLGPNLENCKPFQIAMQTFAAQQVKSLVEFSSITFDPWDTADTYLPHVYDRGTSITAERPDNNGRDEILIGAISDREIKTDK
jgi:hypothetical protein